MVKIFRNYDTLSKFNDESVHPENKICLIKDKGVIYSNGVQYSPYKMHIIQDIVDSDNIVDKFNELRNGLLKSNLMTARTPHTVIYQTGDSTINISGTYYKAQADKVNIDGVEYYQLKFDKDLDNNFCIFNNNYSITNLIFKDVDTSNVTIMSKMFYFCESLTSLDLSGWDISKVVYMSKMFSGCNALTSLDLSGWDTSKVDYMNNMFSGCNALKTIRMIGCSQTTINEIKAKLSTDSITGCTIVTE